MTDPLKRKTRLVILTPIEVHNRPIIAEVKPWGLELREKGRRFRLGIAWGSIYHRAAEIAADKAKAERRAKQEARRKGNK